VKAPATRASERGPPKRARRRFANRIPLLFEAGNDVITKTAAKRINWNAYKINHHTDKVGLGASAG
jgi:DNA topoisomerase VI subunit B